jgi:hypothetical protein
MNKFNVDEIRIDSEGMVILDDDSLKEIESTFVMGSAGGVNNGCLNTTNCIGSQDRLCKNTGACKVITPPMN